MMAVYVERSTSCAVKSKGKAFHNKGSANPKRLF